MQPAGGKREQVGGGGQVPVGMRRGDVAEHGGQDRQPGLHVDAVLVPVPDRQDREGMPEIMNARRALARRNADAGVNQQPGECVLQLTR